MEKDGQPHFWCAVFYDKPVDLGNSNTVLKKTQTNKQVNKTTKQNNQTNKKPQQTQTWKKK